ncbi:hypothetical protein SBA1_100068 [Candidatus Sulfotelmatobacter kueseliae]|uniref:Uncharacterized protein n=1 Tax=Candidatus Sulfotelmatobacter kueseliae TaxID=2042962 RepID=A0A2U3JW12_9BACT|nr:hypothetical protein SBA1_100068 [Candidatus Sulfotelmatobacter kueseliae]
MNFVQKSIQRTRETFREMQRQAAIWRKRRREAEEKNNAALELLLDDIRQEIGLPLTEKNLPTYMLFVQGYLRDRQQKEDEWDGEDFL